MSIARCILWIGILWFTAYFGWKEYAFWKPGKPMVTTFQLANAEKANCILQKWSKEWKEELPWLTRTDYVFIIFYCCLLAGLSAEGMNLEPNPHFNNVLRLSIPLTVILGFSDIAENILFTHNFNYPEKHHNGEWLTLLKFGLLTWIILVLIVAYIRKRMRDNRTVLGKSV